jgi:hypothetical protein
VSLHARQTPSYGRLGTAGFLAAFTGTAILLVGHMLSFLVGVYLQERGSKTSSPKPARRLPRAATK